MSSLNNQAIVLKIHGDLDEAMHLYKEQELICREMVEKGLSAILLNETTWNS